jgi:putative tryptophan/tyrosine transport system substrate-binding protein
MRRREFIGLIGSAAATWPRAARAQQNDRMRRVGAVMSGAEGDPLSVAWSAAFIEGMQQAGWERGRNVQIDFRWTASDPVLRRKYAAEIVATAPDVVVASANSIVQALQEVTRTVPIVFVTTIDPVGGGLVASLAHPGTNATGFTAFEFSLNAKLLDLLRELSPGVTRVAVIRDPSVSAGSGGFAAIQTAAASLGVELTPIGVHDADEIQRGITDFARQPGGGVIVVGPPSSLQPYRDLIVKLTVEHRLPVVYATLAFVRDGALISYGEDANDQYRRAATYVDRILKGEKPADLPVQAPTKLELIVNVKAARAIGLDLPATMLARADEVIE